MTAQQRFQLATQLHQAGQLSEAKAVYEEILLRYPEHADTLHLLGILLSQLGSHEQAVTTLQHAIRIKPQVALFHNNLGTALRKTGRPAEAEAAYSLSIALNPNDPLAHNNLGDIFRSQGRVEEAAAACRHALMLSPDYAQAHNNLGNVLTDLGDSKGALAEYRKAVELGPDIGESHNNLGNALSAVGLPDEAAEAFKNSIRIAPHLAGPHMGLGFVLASQGLIEAAFEWFNRAIQLDPTSAANRSFVLFAAHFHPDYGRREIHSLVHQWAKCARSNIFQTAPHTNQPARNRKLRIGYFSPDFREFIISWLMMPLLENHNADLFEIHCFSSTTRPDAVTKQIRELSAKFHDVAPLSDLQIAEVIRAEGIDILVDLANHTAGNRLPVFAYKPAPVQISYLALFCTSGFKEMDYILCDRFFSPPDDEDNSFVERKLRLPGSFLCFRPDPKAPEVGPLPATKNGYVSFGCLNNLAKVNLRVLQAWARIMTRVSTSRLVLTAQEGSIRAKICQALSENNVACDRVEFVSPKVKYLINLPRLDISLDPFPFGGGGGNTTSDALWMGVPVIKLAGKSAGSLGGVSAMLTAGLDELVVDTVEDYVDLAVMLATDLPRLVLLRSTLRTRMKESPLMDEKAYVSGIESAYRSAWQNWCESNS